MQGFFNWLARLEKWEPPEEWISEEERAARLQAEMVRGTYDDPAIRRQVSIGEFISPRRETTLMPTANSFTTPIRPMRQRDNDEEMER